MCFGGGLQCRDASGAVSWHVPSQYGDTALMAAASRGHRDTAELLLDRGADVEAVDRVSAPPEAAACRTAPGVTGGHRGTMWISRCRRIHASGTDEVGGAGCVSGEGCNAVMPQVR